MIDHVQNAVVPDPASDTFTPDGSSSDAGMRAIRS
jgi:hypothetical protein